MSDNNKDEIKSSKEKNTKLIKFKSIKISKIDPIKIKPDLLDKFKLTGIQDQLKAALSKQIANNDLPESMKTVANESLDKNDVNIKGNNVREILTESTELQIPQFSHSDVNSNKLVKSKKSSKNAIVDNQQQKTKKILNDFLLKKKNNQNIIDVPVKNSTTIISTNLTNAQPAISRVKRIIKIPVRNPKKKIVSQPFFTAENDKQKLMPVIYPAIEIGDETIKINIKPPPTTTPMSTVVRKLEFTEDGSTIIPKTENIASNRTKKLFAVLNEVTKENLRTNLEKPLTADIPKIDNIKTEHQSSPINFHIKNSLTEIQQVANKPIEKTQLGKSLEEISIRQITRNSDLSYQNYKLGVDNNVASIANTPNNITLPSFNKVFILSDEKIESSKLAENQKPFNLLQSQPNNYNYNTNKLNTGLGNQMQTIEMHNSGQDNSSFKPNTILNVKGIDGLSRKVQLYLRDSSVQNLSPALKNSSLNINNKTQTETHATSINSIELLHKKNEKDNLLFSSNDNQVNDLINEMTPSHDIKTENFPNLSNPTKIKMESISLNNQRINYLPKEVNCQKLAINQKTNLYDNNKDQTLDNSIGKKYNMVNKVNNDNFVFDSNIPSSSQKNNIENAVDFLASLGDITNIDDDDTEDIVSINSDDTSDDSESFADFMSRLTNMKKEPKSEPMSPKSKFTVLENKILSEDEQFKIYNVKSFPNFPTVDNSKTAIAEKGFVNDNSSILNFQQSFFEKMPPVVIVPSAEQIENNNSINEVITFNEDGLLIQNISTDFSETQLSKFNTADPIHFDNLNSNNSIQSNNRQHIQETENCFKKAPQNYSIDQFAINPVLTQDSKNNLLSRESSISSRHDNNKVESAQHSAINVIENIFTEKTSDSVERETSLLDKNIKSDAVTKDLVKNNEKKMKTIEENVIQKNNNKKKKIKIPVKLRKPILRGLNVTSTPKTNFNKCISENISEETHIEKSEENHIHEIADQQNTDGNRVNQNISKVVKSETECIKSEIIEVSIVENFDIDCTQNDKINIENSPIHSIDDNTNVENSSIHSIDDSYENDEPFLGFSENLIGEFPENKNIFKYEPTSDHTYTSGSYLNDIANSFQKPIQNKHDVLETSENEHNSCTTIINDELADTSNTDTQKNKVELDIKSEKRNEKNKIADKDNKVQVQKSNQDKNNILIKNVEHTPNLDICKASCSTFDDSNDSNLFYELRKIKKRTRRVISSDHDDDISTSIKHISEDSNHSKDSFMQIKKNDSRIKQDKTTTKKTSICEEPETKRGRFTKKLHPNLLLIRNRSELDQVDFFKFDSKQKPKKTEYQCGMCKEIVRKELWNQHLHSHYGIGWKEGDEPLDLTSRALVLRKLLNYFKSHDSKPLVCRLCKVQYKSGLGILDHISSCGLTLAETQQQCQHCEKKFAASSLTRHLKKCPHLLEKMKQAEIDKKKLEAKESELILNNCGRSKRKSQIKAENKIKKFIDEPEFDPNEHIKNLNIPSGGFYKKFKVKFDENKNAKCPGCNKEFNKYDLFKNHTKICNKIKYNDYQCKLCKKIFSYNEFDQARKHVIDKHKDKPASQKKIKKSLSDSECEINLEDENIESEDDGSLGVDENELSSGSEEEDDVNSNIDDVDEQNLRKRKRIVKSNVLSGSKHLNLIGGDKMFFFDLIKHTSQWMKNFSAHHYSEDTLYGYAIPEYKAIEADFSLEEHLPGNKNSMKFSFSKQIINSKIGTSKSTKPWMQIKQFHSLMFNNEIFLYIGGPITTLKWIPIKKKQNNQFLAITYKTNFHQFVRRVNPKLLKSLVLIYKIDLKIFKKTYDEKNNYKNIHYGIVNYASPINDVAFLPSGGYNENINRLGLMAVAENKPVVSIYSLPIKAPKNCDNYNEINILQLVCKIQLKLTLLEDDSENNIDEKLFDNYTNVQCTKIIWSKSKDHNYLISGYSNGFIAIWDINKDNSLCNTEINNVQISTPINYFMVTDKSINGLDVHYDESNNPRWLIVTSVSRAIKVYDIENFMQPICIMEETARSFPTDCTWPVTWENPCVSISNDLFQSSITAYNPLGIYHKQHRYCRSWDSIKTINFNPWINLMAAGCDNGDFLIEVNGEMNQDVSLKRFFDKTFFSFTDLISLDGSSIPILKEESPKRNKKPEKKSKEWVDAVQNDLKLFDDDYANKYGLIFGELNFVNFDRKMNSIDDRIPPFFLNCFVRINNVTWNENEYANNFCAIGYENGFIRVIDFDVMKFKREGKIL